MILDVPNFDRSRIDESSQSIENIRLNAVSIGADASYGTDMSDTVAIFGLDAHVFVLRFFRNWSKLWAFVFIFLLRGSI